MRRELTAVDPLDFVPDDPLGHEDYGSCFYQGPRKAYASGQGWMLSYHTRAPYGDGSGLPIELDQGTAANPAWDRDRTNCTRYHEFRPWNLSRLNETWADTAWFWYCRNKEDEERDEEF